MFLILARILLAKVITDPSIKKAVVAELKELAAKTDSTWDDAAVQRVEEAWNVVAPIVLGKLK